MNFHQTLSLKHCTAHGSDGNQGHLTEKTFLIGTALIQHTMPTFHCRNGRKKTFAKNLDVSIFTDFHMQMLLDSARRHTGHMTIKEEEIPPACCVV